MLEAALKTCISVRVTMVGQTGRKRLLGSRASLVDRTRTDVTSVIVLDTDNKPHKQKVEVTGIRDGGDVQITDGLSGRGARSNCRGIRTVLKMDDMSRHDPKCKRQKSGGEEE